MTEPSNHSVVTDVAQLVRADNPLFSTFGPDEDDVRQGALQGVMAEAVALAAGLPATEVRRACMLRGDLPAVDGAEAGDHAVGVRPAVLQSEARGAVPPEGLHLGEGTLVQQQRDALQRDDRHVVRAPHLGGVAAQLDCARFMETGESKILTEAGGRTRRRSPAQSLTFSGANA